MTAESQRRDGQTLGEYLLERNEAATDRQAFRESLTDEQRARLEEAYAERERETERINREWQQQQGEHRANEARQHEPGAKPKPKTKKSPTGKPRRPTGFSQGRANQRRADLFAVHRHDFKKRYKKAATASFEAFVSRLAATIPRRDLLDPDSVTPAELGAHLNITLAVRIAIEEQETAYRVGKGWTKPGGKGYRLKTVVPCDSAPEDVELHYRQIRSRAQAASRKQARAELRRQQPKETEMQTHTTHESSAPTYIDLLATQVARTRSQIDALRKVIDGEWRTLADLMARVHHDPAWREIDDVKLRQTVVDRLHTMSNDIENEYAPGRRGSRLRLVRRRYQTLQTDAQDRRTV